MAQLLTPTLPAHRIFDAHAEPGPAGARIGAARRSSRPAQAGMLGRLSKLNRGISRRVRFRMHTRHCPLCGWHGFAFLPFGNEKQRRDDAFCPGCQSVERHRLAYLMLKDTLGRHHRTLHVAPEPGIKQWLQASSQDYLSVGLGEHVMRSMDLTALDLPDACMTLVWCSHVLEHIEDAAAAMKEMFRVLVPGGTAVLQVPIGGETTYEDLTIQDEAGRLAAFEQVDHVRIFGLDLADRLRAAGFEVQVRKTEELSPRAVRRHALARPMTNEIFVCTKPRR